MQINFGLIIPTLLITGQHPHLDACHLQIGYCLRHTILQLVFNRRNSYQLKVTLDLLVNFTQLILTRVQSKSGFMLAFAPGIEKIFLNVTLGQDKSAKTLASEFLWEDLKLRFCVTILAKLKLTLRCSWVRVLISYWLCPSRS